MGNNYMYMFRKVKTLVDRQGASFTFKRTQKDEYGEPTGEEDIAATIRGVFRQREADFISVTGTEAASIERKHPQGIVTVWDYSIGIVRDDYIELNGKTFKVSSITNIRELNIVADIDLEEVV